MPYDQDLADRIRESLEGDPSLVEKKMFGGLAFMLAGHLAVVASHDGGLMVRVDPERTERLIASTVATPMVMRGSEMKGWVRVPGAEVRTSRQLTTWVQLGIEAATALPPKRPRVPKRV